MNCCAPGIWSCCSTSFLVTCAQCCPTRRWTSGLRRFAVALGRTRIYRTSSTYGQTHFRCPCCCLSRTEAKKTLHEKEAEATERVEQQRLEVQEAQWKYFCSALAQDQESLQTIQSAPPALRQKLHAKQVAARRKLINAAEQGCKEYQELVSVLTLLCAGADSICL